MDGAIHEGNTGAEDAGCPELGLEARAAADEASFRVARLDDSDASIWEEERDYVDFGEEGQGSEEDPEESRQPTGHDSIREPGSALGAPPRTDAPVAGGSRSARDKVIDAFEAMFMDAVAIGHYQTDYYTKGGPLASDIGVLQQQRAGLYHLREEQEAELPEERAARLGTSSRWAQVLDSARRTLIRLTTSANRALLKKLPEMAFQLQFGHDCYCSRATWTIFCKGIVALAFQASSAVRTGKGDNWDDEAAGDIEAEPPGGDDDGGAGVAGRGVMDHLGESRASFVPAGPGYAGDRGADQGDQRPGDAARGQAFRVATEHDLRTNWLHRGVREPLASMGIYHYAMYVYTAQGDPLRFDVEDFVTYRFADTHPCAAVRVQKLRVGATFMAPRIFGFTMPTRAKDAETNAMFKSVLFRPLCAGDRGAPWVPFKGIVGDGGSFVNSWQSWWAQQLRLLGHYEECERRAGKLFTLEDIDMSLGPEAELGPSRLRPSAAEFMARWTVEVATNMDLGAEARGRPRTKIRPDGGEFEPEEARAVGPQEPGRGAQEGVADEGAGPVKLADEDELDEAWAQKKALHAVSNADVLKVAMYEGVRGASRMQRYKTQFLDGYGKQHDPRPSRLEVAGAMSFAPRADLDRRRFDALRREQLALLRKKKLTVTLMRPLCTASSLLDLLAPQGLEALCLLVWQRAGPPTARGTRCLVSMRASLSGRQRQKSPIPLYSIKSRRT